MCSLPGHGPLDAAHAHARPWEKLPETGLCSSGASATAQRQGQVARSPTCAHTHPGQPGRLRKGMFWEGAGGWPPSSGAYRSGQTAIQVVMSVRGYHGSPGTLGRVRPPPPKTAFQSED